MAHLNVRGGARAHTHGRGRDTLTPTDTYTCGDTLVSGNVLCVKLSPSQFRSCTAMWVDPRAHHASASAACTGLRSLVVFVSSFGTPCPMCVCVCVCVCLCVCVFWYIF